MPNITFIDHKGVEFAIEATSGKTIMQAALDNCIDGIVAECGGTCSCGTCHCYIDEQWLDKMPQTTNMETETLECSIGVQPNSRLSCQVTLNDNMNGLVVRLPEFQL
jgi:ferredoxin, 2Fe-2S